MKWRNEQMYHLRQNKLLTNAKQDKYFKDVISQLYDADKPDQILFSYFYNNEFVGYGGIVHINWVDKNAEISFLINTELEKNDFELHWGNFLNLIEIVAFQDLKFHKLYTYAFDIRPNLYKILESSNFKNEARLIQHCFFNGKYIDVIIHSKINE
jgi:RimJ/RimL family protein N-acetyltransferase